MEVLNCSLLTSARAAAWRYFWNSSTVRPTSSAVARTSSPARVAEMVTPRSAAPAATEAPTSASRPTFAVPTARSNRLIVSSSTSHPSLVISSRTVIPPPSATLTSSGLGRPDRRGLGFRPEI